MIYLGDKPVGVVSKIDQTKWVRPENWPDLDSIDYTDFEGGYFTFDLDAIDYNVKWASFYVTPNPATIGCVIQRGHLANGVFVSDETLQFSGNYSRNLLNATNGRIQLFRITGNGIKTIALASNSSTSAECLHSKASPCVEIALRLPYAYGTVANDPNHALYNYVSFTSVFTKKIKLIDFGKDASSLLDFNHAFARCNGITIEIVGSHPRANSINRMFDSSIMDIIDLSKYDLSQCTNCGQAFVTAKANKIIFKGSGLTNPTNLDSIVGSALCPYIDASGCDFSNTRSDYGSVFANELLTDYFPPSLSDINYDYRVKFLTRDSLVRIFNALPITSTEGRKITIGFNANKLSLNDIAIATGKGWTVA